MVTDSPFEFSLAKNATLSVCDTRGIYIECLEGSLWITLDGSFTDIVVNGGESFFISRHAPAVMNALSHSRVRLSLKLTRTSSFLDVFKPGRSAGVSFHLTLRPGKIPHPAILSHRQSSI